MKSAAPQDSRTQNTFATTPREELDSAATTWAFLYPPALQTTDTTTTTAAQTARHQEKIAYRDLFFEHVIAPRLTTDAGRQTMWLRWNAIEPATLTEEEILARIKAVNDAVDAATKATIDRETKRCPASPGRSFLLPVEVDEAERSRLCWQCRTIWEDVALRELIKWRDGQKTCQSGRVAVQHLPFILSALAYFADDKTGHNCAASNRRIASLAQRFACESTRNEHTNRGRKTTTLSLKTLERAVKAIVSDLCDIGLIVERARGRHLSAGERVLAYFRHRRYQTRAASVRDLVMPAEFWRNEPRPTRPAWACDANPFMHRKNATFRLTEMVKTLFHFTLLSPHPHVVRRTYFLTVSTWLLNALTRFAETPTPSKQNRRGFKPPSKGAKKIASDLVHPEIGNMGWLLRHQNQPGKKYHLNALARVIDAAGGATSDAATILTSIDSYNAERGWEFHPEEIKRPLAWLSAVLRQQAQSDEVSRALDELAREYAENPTCMHACISSRVH
ncbi:hypothetical protein [uncultured Corynebacterium sp.]|uniref:hypothetical protein n=1 Tax=uncultured Corynebacterium sp. TaxID=159447 RepID=UPI002615A22C|nr:hypothetical protein [uncultured Corynebacterium sp.]